MTHLVGQLVHAQSSRQHIILARFGNSYEAHNEQDPKGVKQLARDTA